MSMDDWAKNEIEIACKYERGDKEWLLKWDDEKGPNFD